MKISELDISNIIKGRKGRDIKYNRNGNALLTLDEAKVMVHHWYHSGMSMRGYERKYELTTNTILRQRARIKYEESLNED